MLNDIVFIIRIQVRQAIHGRNHCILSRFILIARRALKNFTFLLMGDLRLKLFFSNEIFVVFFSYFWLPA